MKKIVIILLLVFISSILISIELENLYNIDELIDYIILEKEKNLIELEYEFKNSIDLIVDSLLYDNYDAIDMIIFELLYENSLEENN